MASSSMKVGGFPNLSFCISCGKFILRGLGVSGSKIFSTSLILSCLIVFGVNPDCLMTVKNAFSLIWHSLVIWLISSII